MSKIIKLSYLNPNIPSTVRYTVGEKILINNNDNFSGQYYITSVEYQNDFKNIFIGIDCEKPNVCLTEPFIGAKLFPNDNIFSITDFDKTLSYANFGWSTDTNKSGSGIIIGAHKTDKIIDYPRKNVGIAWYYFKHQDYWKKYEFISPKITNFGEFGKSVAINDNNIIAIGEPFYSNIDSYIEKPFNYGHGAAHIFSFQTGNSPTGQLITSLTGNGAPFSQFGYSLDLNNNGSILIIGAPTDVGINNITGGKVYLYRNISNNWQLSHTLTGLNNFGYFGKCVKINSGNLIVIAENEYFHVYSYNNNILNKTHTFNLNYDNFQNSYNYNFNKFIDVDTSGNNILIGNPYHKTGIVKLYRKNLNNWDNIFSKTGSSGVSYFGASVGFNGQNNNIYIGSPKENSIFIYTGNNFQFSGKIGYNESKCPSSFSGLGSSISIDENSNAVVVGAYSSLNNNTNSNGAAFLLHETQILSFSSSSSSSSSSITQSSSSSSNFVGSSSSSSSIGNNYVPCSNARFIADMFSLLLYRQPTNQEFVTWSAILGASTSPGQTLAPISNRADMVMNIMGYTNSVPSDPAQGEFSYLNGYQSTAGIALQTYARLSMTPSLFFVNSFLNKLSSNTQELPYTSTYADFLSVEGASYGLALGLQEVINLPNFEIVHPGVNGLTNLAFIPWMDNNSSLTPTPPAYRFMFTTNITEEISIYNMMEAFVPQTDRKGAGMALATKFVLARNNYDGYGGNNSETLFQLRANAAALKFQLMGSNSNFWDYNAAFDASSTYYSKALVEQYIDTYWNGGC